MSIYVIGDLHLALGQNKPMSIFGQNWDKHEEKIKANWLSKVKDDDLVVLPGDFSWAMYLEDSYCDFKYLSELPGKKVLLKGNHDYWWTNVTKMEKYLKNNNFANIEFLHNSAIMFEDKILVGTRGWTFAESENSTKMINREKGRLELSIQDGIKKFGQDKEIICFMHYPPLISNVLEYNDNLEFYKIMKKYNIKRCFYGHMHGKAISKAINGFVGGIEFRLISSDYLNFDLMKIACNA